MKTYSILLSYVNAVLEQSMFVLIMKQTTMVKEQKQRNCICH